ncbi:hypothetical protein ETU09_02780 [Apibacter muscae]|uniref:Tox-MPTase4 domain-containing protein n=2 Tax=Apibacter muscae TaxID=2509004 RepID=A0A563DJD7_9FLAO|nr:hypothetical protein ETU09_02780 [Apibacter muscae]
MYVAMHEGFHVKQWGKLGYEEYNKQSRLQKEKYVYDELMKNKGVLTEWQINHAGAYNKYLEIGDWPIKNKEGFYIY